MTKKEEKVRNIVLIILFGVIVAFEGSEVAIYCLAVGLCVGLFGIIAIKVLNYFSSKKNEPPE